MKDKEIEKKQNKNVFVIVRETAEFKKQLEDNAIGSGFGTLSDYVRDMWRKWLK